MCFLWALLFASAVYIGFTWPNLPPLGEGALAYRQNVINLKSQLITACTMQVQGDLKTDKVLSLNEEMYSKY